MDQLRAEVRKLLVGIDLKTFTIGWGQLGGSCDSGDESFVSYEMDPYGGRTSCTSYD